MERQREDVDRQENQCVMGVDRIGHQFWEETLTGMVLELCLKISHFPLGLTCPSQKGIK